MEKPFVPNCERILERPKVGQSPLNEGLKLLEGFLSGEGPRKIVCGRVASGLYTGGFYLLPQGA